MKSAILSHVDLNDCNNDYSLEYNGCIEDLIQTSDVLKLDAFYQHFNTSRLQHSINVSYYSYLICRFFGWDYRSAARAGLLHDLFLYNWREEKQPEGYHAKAHPVVALKNAKKITTLNNIEEDAILNHMWPVTPAPPRYKESFVVSFVDKYCACCEVVDYYHIKAGFTRAVFRWMLNGGVYAR